MSFRELKVTTPKMIGLSRKRIHCVVISALALCVCSLPANASTVLFSDLGTGTDIFSEHAGYVVAGGVPISGIPSFMAASQFTVAGLGSFSVSEIDVAMVAFGAVDTFSASIWTDVGGSPGTEMDGASWSASALPDPGGVVSITGITGVALTGGQAYFLVLGPLSATDDSNNDFPFNVLGVTGDAQFSTDGGATWRDHGADSELGAFDILGNAETVSTPEPGQLPLLLFGIGLVSLLAASRRKFPRSQ